MVKPIPDRFHSINAYVIVSNVVEAMAFYAKVFGGETVARMPGPDGQSTLHAEMRVGDSTLMLCDENPEWGAKSPHTLGGSPIVLHLYVEDADAVFNRAVDAGSDVTQAIHNAFWGDRYARIIDPFGHAWAICTHKEDLTPEEMNRRAEIAMGQDGDLGEPTQ